MNDLNARARLYMVAVISVGAVTALGQTLWLRGEAVPIAPFLLLLSTAVLAQRFGVDTPQHTRYHVTPALFFAGVLLLPVNALALLILLAYLPMALYKRAQWHLPVFNAATHIIGTGLAAAILHQSVANLALTTPQLAPAVITAALFYVASNHALVAFGLHYMRDIPLRESGLLSVESMGTNLLINCVGATVALLWIAQPALAVLGAAPLAMLQRVLTMPLLAEEARLDAKTNLYNARYLNKRLTEELQRADQLGFPVAVLMADLDGLRRVNNAYGHLVGDEVLGLVAATLRKVVGPHGIVGRFGGEEFVIGLPDADRDEALALAERLRKEIAAQTLYVDGHKEPIQVTMTVGVAVFPRDATSVRELIRQADTALYQGKDEGRNRVILADVGYQNMAESAVVMREPQVATVRAAATSARERRTVTELLGQATLRGNDVIPFPLWLLVGVVAAAGLLLTIYYAPHLAYVPVLGLVLFAGLTLAGEGLSLDLYATSTVSLGFVFMLSAGFMFGPAAVLVTAPVLALTHAYRRRPPIYKAAFNLGMYTLAGSVAALTFQWLAPEPRLENVAALLLPAMLAAAANYAVNVGLVTVAIAVQTSTDPWQVYKSQFQWLWAHYVTLGIIALVVVIAYVELGAVGVFPFLLPLLIMRHSQKQYIERTAEVTNVLKALNQDLIRANKEAAQANEELLVTLANIIDSRDPYVYNHSLKVAQYAVAIARELGWPSDRIETLRRAAVCHDIGKIGISEQVLHKQDELTPHEYEYVKRHVAIGVEFLENSQSLQQLIPAVKYHHERYDGQGYPGGFKGADIPLEARVLAVADATEVMASDRPYKPGLKLDQIIEELKACRGTHFDPAVVEAFLRVIEREGPDYITNSARDVIPPQFSWSPSATGEEQDAKPKSGRNWASAAIT